MRVGHDDGVANATGKAAVAPAKARAELVEALLLVSRAMVGLAGRSLSGLPAEVTLPQFRAMVVLASRGPQRVLDISQELGVNPSTGTRMCERLAGKGLLARERDDDDRRQLRVSLTETGRKVVDEVTRRRREELRRIVDTLPRSAFGPTAQVLRDVAAAAGEPEESEWWLGWDPSGPH